MARNIRIKRKSKESGLLLRLILPIEEKENTLLEVRDILIVFINTLRKKCVSIYVGIGLAASGVAAITFLILAILVYMIGCWFLVAVIPFSHGLSHGGSLDCDHVPSIVMKFCDMIMATVLEKAISSRVHRLVILKFL